MKKIPPPKKKRSVSVLSKILEKITKDQTSNNSFNILEYT